jgi:hypothetical protein
MPIHNLRERISRRSLDRSADHGDDDTKSISSVRTSMSSRSRKPKLVSPTLANRPTLGAFFNVSKQQDSTALRSEVNHRQKELDVRKNRKSSILASLDRFIDGDRDEATDVTTETVPISDHSISSHMSLERRPRPPSAQRKYPKLHDSSPQSVGGEEVPPRKERYPRRRGSVTKFSIDDQQEDGLSREEFDGSASMLSIGVDSVQSDSVLQQNSGTTSTPRYRRRGSVTKFSFEATQEEEQVKQPKQPMVQKDFDGNVSLSSFDGDSVQSDNIPPRRYRRRNSVTKFSLEEPTTEQAPRKKDTLCSSNSSLPVSSTIGGDHAGSFSSSLGNISGLCDEDGPGGYGSTHRATPPPRATLSPDAYRYREETDSFSQRPPRKERYRRRGSVTKYSLEAQDQVKKELGQAGSTLKKKELEDSSTTINKELEDSSTHSLQFEDLVLVARSKSSTDTLPRPPRHPAQESTTRTLPAD